MALTGDTNAVFLLLAYVGLVFLLATGCGVWTTPFLRDTDPEEMPAALEEGILVTIGLFFESICVTLVKRDLISLRICL